MINQKRILLLDIDGTILNKEYDTDKKVWLILSDLIKEDIVVSIVTSRPFAFSWHIITRLQNSTHHIFDKGAYITNVDKFALSVTIPSQVSHNIYEAINMYMNDIRFGVSKGKFFYSNYNYTSEIQTYLEMDYFERLEDIQDFSGVNSIWVRDLPIRALSSINNLIPKNLSITVNDNKSTNLVDIFIHSKICKKETFINYLSKLNGTSLKTSMAIGDSMEDARFLSKSKHVYCPGNSVPEIIKLSNYVAKGHYSKGVLEILEKIKKEA